MDAKLLRRRTRIRGLLSVIYDREMFSDRWERLAHKYAKAHGVPDKDAEFIVCCLGKEALGTTIKQFLDRPDRVTD
jgi:hypothetical protein